MNDPQPAGRAITGNAQSATRPKRRARRGKQAKLLRQINGRASGPVRPLLTAAGPLPAQTKTAAGVKTGGGERGRTMTRKTTSRIDAALEADFADAWRPAAGDRLVGTVISLSERPGFEGRPYPIITIQPDEGEPLAVHAFHGVLMDELGKAGPKVGERLGIKYLGKVDGGGRGSYHSYRVAVDRPVAAIDWSRYSEDVPADGGLNRPLDQDQADAETQAALEAEQAEIDAASDEIPF